MGSSFLKITTNLRIWDDQRMWAVTYSSHRNRRLTQTDNPQ